VAPHHVCVRVLTHIKRLDDCFGDFLVRVVCKCGACREIQLQALARLVGWKTTPAADAMFAVRQKDCTSYGGCEAKATLSAEESALNRRYK
jgi:hypothetical protein